MKIRQKVALKKERTTIPWSIANDNQIKMMNTYKTIVLKMLIEDVETIYFTFIGKYAYLYTNT